MSELRERLAEVSRVVTEEAQRASQTAEIVHQISHILERVNAAALATLETLARLLAVAKAFSY
jgi:hypothetical protein